jgi:protein-L-isoaspartate O-methyltransferase
VGAGSGFVTALAACMLGGGGTVHGIECLSSRLEQARANLRVLRERLPPENMLRGLLGDAHSALAAARLSLTNVLIPECTDGQLYDAIYCDTTLSEEDLPAFLALLKPQGRMTVVIEEELLCITRSGADAHCPHDFTRWGERGWGVGGGGAVRGGVA